MSSSMIEVVSESEVESNNRIQENFYAEQKTIGLPSSFEEEMDVEKNGELAMKMGFGNDDLFYSPQDKISPYLRKKRGRNKSSYFSRKDIESSNDLDYGATSLPVCCEICGKKVANGKYLIQHMATHDENKQFECPYCQKCFPRLVHLESHLVAHGIEKQFQCPICHQRFSRQDCVKIHMRIHDKSQCLKCVVCQKRFQTYGSLKAHIRIHKGEKPFKCHICMKCFTQKGHLISHIKRHSRNSDEEKTGRSLGPRMFKCEYCPKAFVRISDHENHMQWNHEDISTLNSTNIPNKYVSYENSVSQVKPKKKANMRKIMYSTSTQTESEGGYVIIPRKYQTTSLVSRFESPNPHGAEGEDMFENDIYDEGMDRNFSSDEEEEGGTVENKTQQSISRSVSAVNTFSNSTAKTSLSAEEAFDAVIGVVKENNSKNSDELIEGVSSSKNTTAEAAFDRNSNGESASVLSGVRLPMKATSYISQINENIMNNRVTDINSNNSQIKESSKIPRVSKPLTEVQKTQLKGSRILQHFDTKNWKRVGKIRRRKGERPPKTDVKALIGLTGPTHLSLIRNSMRNFILDKPPEEEEESQILSSAKTTDASGSNEDKLSSAPEQVTSEEVSINDAAGRGKRQSKTKKHEKDFVCNLKSCDICNPVVVLKASEDVEINEISESSEINTEESSANIPATSTDGHSSAGNNAGGNSSIKEQSQKLLQFLLSGDESALQGTDFMLNIPDQRPSDISYQSFDNFAISNGDDTDDQSVVKGQVSLPTFSCKICGRLYRFEGKLHRHIESVHQNKQIFSPDVKPGRGLLIKEESFNYDAGQFVEKVERPMSYRILMKNKNEQLPQFIKKKRKSEIDALRSEWDDDNEVNNDDGGGDFDDDEEEIDEQDVVLTRPQSTRHDVIQHKSSFISNRSVAQYINSSEQNYSSGVKVNINKLIARPHQISWAKNSKKDSPGISTDQGGVSILSKPEDTLDEKCQNLLQKLFNRALLVKCGLFIDHVSVVLGKVLQYYGVKMIEDYGQGQYEVLKYNLWRLIEWKVTMEQMEEFYSEGKSVEEMMDDIMIGRVPVISHREPGSEVKKEESSNEGASNGDQPVQALEVSNNQLMLSQVANVIGEQINLGEGMTQVVLAQNVSPEMLKGAHIVTIDPSTGQVISQVTADQVILADSLEANLSHGQAVVTEDEGTSSSPVPVTQISSFAPGTIINTSGQVRADGSAHKSSTSNSDSTVEQSKKN